MAYGHKPPAPSPATRHGRAAGGAGPHQCLGRGRDPSAHGHRADLAEPVRPGQAAGPGGPQTLGAPCPFPPVEVAEAKALACQLPAETGTPLSRWSCPELAAELTARGTTDSISASTVRR
jgi:hypothetical protein